MRDMTHRTAAILVMIGGSLVAIGSLLPWLTARTGFGSVSVMGTDGDGLFSLVGSVIVVLIAVVYMNRDAERAVRALLILGGLAGLLIVVGDYEAIQVRIAAITSTLLVASIGPGLYLIGIGCVVVIVGALNMTEAAADEPTTP